VRICILLLGLLSCSVNALADWQTKVVRDPLTDFSQFSLRPSDDFPLFTFSCVSVAGSPIDILQIDRLSRVQSDDVEKIEIQVDDNPALIFFPDQYKINIAYNYHPQLESGIETVTLMPNGNSGEIQFVELVRQLIAGYNAVAWARTATRDTKIEFSLLGFTRAYLSMRTACLDYVDTRAQASN